MIMICRVSYYSKLRFITRTGTENLFIAEIQYFLRVVNGDAEVLRLAVCKLYPATYGLSGMRTSEDIMSASLGSQLGTSCAAAMKVLAVEVSELDTKLVTAKDDNKLYAVVYGNTSGMA